MAQTILVIDDSASLRQVVAMALQGAGYEVLQAGDGQAAESSITRMVCAIWNPYQKKVVSSSSPAAWPALPVLW